VLSPLTGLTMTLSIVWMFIGLEAVRKDEKRISIVVVMLRLRGTIYVPLVSSNALVPPLACRCDQSGRNGLKLCIKEAVRFDCGFIAIATTTKIDIGFANGNARPSHSVASGNQRRAVRGRRIRKG